MWRFEHESALEEVILDLVFLFFVDDFVSFDLSPIYFPVIPIDKSESIRVTSSTVDSEFTILLLVSSALPAYILVSNFLIFDVL